MYEIKRPDGNWWLVESLADARREFGSSFEEDSFRPALPARTIEFTSVGPDVYQHFDDGSEEHLVTASTEDAAAEIARRCNRSHPHLR